MTTTENSRSSEVGASPPRSHSLRRQLVFSGGILALLGVVAFALNRPSPAGPAASHDAPSAAIAVSDMGSKIADIETALVQKEQIHDDLHATGQVSFSSDQSVKVSPRLQGRVRQVFVRVGDHVAAGQTLAILDSVDAATALTVSRQNENKLRLAQDTLDRQQRLFALGTPDVTAAQAALDQAQATLLAKQDVLARTRTQAEIGGFTEKPVEDARSMLVAAKSAQAQAQSDLAQAQRDYDRKTRLVEIGVAAKSDQEASLNVLEKARVAVDADREAVALATKALAREQKAFKTNLYADQQVRSAESDYRQAQLQQAAAEKVLRLARAQIQRDLRQARSDLLAAQIDAANAKLALSLMGKPNPDGTIAVLAPIAGVVTERNVSPGQMVDQSQMTPWQMLTISNTSTVWVDADIYEKDIQSITPGLPVTIHVAALPDRTFTGVVRRIAPTLDTKTRSVKVRAEIANPDGQFKDGMYADVTIHLRGGKSALAIPLAAVQHDGDTDAVFVATGGKYVKRSIRLGATQGPALTT